MQQIKGKKPSKVRVSPSQYLLSAEKKSSKARSSSSQTFSRPTSDSFSSIQTNEKRPSQARVYPSHHLPSAQTKKKYSSKARSSPPQTFSRPTSDSFSSIQTNEKRPSIARVSPPEKLSENTRYTLFSMSTRSFRYTQSSCSTRSKLIGFFIVILAAAAIGGFVYLHSFSPFFKKSEILSPSILPSTLPSSISPSGSPTSLRSKSQSLSERDEFSISLSPSSSPSSSLTRKPFPKLSQHKILAPDGSALKHFGCSVDISGGLVAVGAYEDNENGTFSGSAYLLHSTGEVIAKLIAPDGAALDYFGSDISISAKNKIVVVGAYGDDDNGTGSGSAYLFSTTGEFMSKLNAPYESNFAYFGWSVDISETVIVIGAYGDEDNKGSAYLFSVTGNVISKLMAPNGSHNERFGWSVAASKDVVVVGTKAKSAYLFTSEGNFKSILAVDIDNFGNSVAISNDIVAIGAYVDGDNDTRKGSVLLFSTNNGDFVSKIDSPHFKTHSNFGSSLGISGNVVAIGDDWDSDNGWHSGAVYLFSNSGDFLSKVSASDGCANDGFGGSLALSDEVLIVGASSDADFGLNSGSAHVFDDLDFTINNILH